MSPANAFIGAALGLMLLASAGCAAASPDRSVPTPLPVVKDLSGTRAQGRLEPIRYAEIAPMFSGLVSEVLVAAGDQVEAGQLIARLDNLQVLSLEEARAQAAVELGAANEAVRAARDALDQFGPPRIFVGMTAEEAARAWLAELDAAREQFAPFSGTSRTTLKPRSAFPQFVYPSLPGRVLFETGEYDGVARESKKRVDLARANYTKAVGWLQLESALSLAEARVADAQRRFTALSDPSLAGSSAGIVAGLATAEIRAPYAGTVTDISLEVGEIAAAGKPVVTVADFSAWLVKTTDLTEIDVVTVLDSMPVSVEFDALPGVAFAGRVLAVDLRFTDRQGDVVYPVSILLVDSDPGMRWGMTAEVTFEE